MKNHRENLCRLYRREGYDFVPVQFELCPAVIEKVREKYGDCDYCDLFDFSNRDINIPPGVHRDTDWTKLYPEGTFKLENTIFDAWGVAYEKTPESMHMRRMYHPLEKMESLTELDAYPLPQSDGIDITPYREEVEKWHQKGYFASGILACSIWETAWYMRGMETMMIGMLDNDSFTNELFDRVTAISAKRAVNYALAGCDMINLGDDIGMQKTIMMSLELYRQHIKPRLTHIIKEAKKVNPDIIIGYHSCGFVEPFINDLIDAGVEVLNPVQPECMSFEEIHKNYGDRISFCGTLGTQQLMPFGTPQEVREETFRNLRIAGRHGGLLPCPTHVVEPEVPLENIEAYVEACRDFVW